MPRYSFEARDGRGRVFKGELEAPSEGEARIKLRAQKLMPTRLSQSEQKVAVLKKVGGKGVPAKANPWMDESGKGAEGLEWQVPSPAPFHTFETPPKLDATATRIIA